MRNTSTAIAGLAVVACVLSSAPVWAQVPYIEGTWKLNVKASQLRGAPPPQTHVRSYRLGPDGVLVGQAIVVEANGAPRFLIFAGKPNGQGDREFDTQSAAQYLANGTIPPRTYAESPTQDNHRIKWVDRIGDRVLFLGERWVSLDGKTMSFTVHPPENNDPTAQQLYVFDRTGP
jgi:hypothetical protein